MVDLGRIQVHPMLVSYTVSEAGRPGGASLHYVIMLRPLCPACMRIRILYVTSDYMSVPLLARALVLAVYFPERAEGNRARQDLWSHGAAKVQQCAAADRLCRR